MNEWISVDKELPEEIGGYYSSRVLVYTTSGKMEVGYLMNGQWLRDNGGKSFYECGYEIRFWQPLPEKPPQLIETHTQAEINSWDVGVN